jgi:hypothetical protein
MQTLSIKPNLFNKNIFLSHIVGSRDLRLLPIRHLLKFEWSSEKVHDGIVIEVSFQNEMRKL